MFACTYVHTPRAPEWLHSSYGKGWHVPRGEKAKGLPRWHSHRYHSEQTKNESVTDPPDTLGERFWRQVSVSACMGQVTEEL